MNDNENSAPDRIVRDDRCADHRITCHDCGALSLLDEAHEVDDEWYCDPCFRRLTPRNIHNYGYRPQPLFGYRRSEVPGAGEAASGNRVVLTDDCRVSPHRTYGVELECDGGDDADAAAGDVLSIGEDRVYCKHDGSLDDGFEIVSHPGTLAYHMYEMHWKQMCIAAIARGFLSHGTNTCGLHIHLGRRQLGKGYTERELTAAKLVLLVDRHWDNIVTFSRRDRRRLEQWAGRPDVEATPEDADEVALHKARFVYDKGRYEAVNLQNADTIEFRFFRGTLNRDTLIASMQLIDNLCVYALSHGVHEVLNSAWADLIGAVPYDELNAYCLDEDDAVYEYDWDDDSAYVLPGWQAQTDNGTPLRFQDGYARPEWVSVIRDKNGVIIPRASSCRTTE